MLATRIARLLGIDSVLRDHTPGVREFLISRWMGAIGAARSNRLSQCGVVQLGRALGWNAQRNFLLLGAARSGTTLLVDYLNCHPRIRCRSEILNPHFEVYGNPRKMHRNRLRLHIEANFVKRPGIWAGAKILTYQLDELDLSLWDLLEILQRPATIVLYRGRVIEQYMSLKMAEQTKIWHSTVSGRAQPIQLDLGDFVTFAAREHRMWSECLAGLAHTKVHYVSYEQLAADPCAVMNDLFKFLGLAPAQVRSDFVKLNPQPLEQRLINYDEFLRSGVLASTQLQVPARVTFADTAPGINAHSAPASVRSFSSNT
jgi:hypothetical protein